ncbi:trypsin-like peptidase domain-containing protein [Streptomyces antimycoticus]|uniref:trypsin-like peptidase domain-containing protein n=1 Tax=Streptomyces antimycoticus TaxID=68175 RepID=UPI002570B7D1|nr:trypsin-like peptidase domain-containing protein [Streptomyces antimycoticus]WJD97392.1 trypsin-like peptidase domain-containing protein [Streptomyces antimycoticus]
MDEPKAPKPKWWSRPVGARPGDRSSDAAEGAEERTEAAAAQAPPEPVDAPVEGRALEEAAPRPLHEPDPYSTPPYGGPGPWAPAPPVQHPVATPAQGTHVPPGMAQTPPQAPGMAPASPQTTGMAQAPPQAPGMAQTPPQAPGVTPPHGTTLPPATGPVPGQSAPVPMPSHPGMTPPHGTQLPVGPGEPHRPPAAMAQPAPTAQWRGYDPWAVVPPPAAPKTRKTVSRRGAWIAVLLIALVAGCIGGGIGAYAERDNASGGVDVKLPQAPVEKEARAPGSVAGIAAASLPGVVTIHVRGSSEEGTGTGFVLDKQGHILTNNHVVQPAGADGDISVTFNSGQDAKAEIIGRDAGYDLAVVKVDRVSGLTPLPLGNSDSVRVGDPVVAIGAPFDLAGTVTSGIISAKERPITAGGEKEDGSDVSYVDALQTDAPINPGNSGGPLVDRKGRVIGINSAIRAADDGSGLGGGQGGSIGLGFAIPINQGKRVAEELINTGKATHPVIGVTLDMGYTGDGARVNTKGAGSGPPVTSDGPGDKAGIKAGDVITEVDGVPVHSGQELIVKIRSHRPGDRLALTLKRDGKTRTAELTLGSASSG